MAISNTIYAGSQTKWGISQSSDFDAAASASANFELLEGPVPTGIDYGVFRDTGIKNDGTRVLQDNSVFYTESNGLRVIPFSDLIVRRIDLGSLMYAVLQNVSEGAATPYTKTYTLDNTTTQPLFSNNAGYFCQLGIFDPPASHMLLFRSCILRSLTLTANFLSGDPRLRASGEWISGFDTTATANLTGTWAYNAQNYYDFGALTTKQIAGVDVVVYGFTITFTNNAVRAGNSSGDAEIYVLPSYDVSGEITVKLDPNVQGIRADGLDGTGTKIQIAVGTAAQAGHFDITLNETFLGDVQMDYGNEAGTAVVIPFQARYDASGSTALATVTISDATDQSW